ncbi:iron ABC transporter, partial [Roseomonas alkaliterrae]|nr:iron ABC transporter [Neoroseomonas alkaliterrae]
MSASLAAPLPRERRALALLPLGLLVLAGAMLAGVLLGPARISAAGLFAT